MIHAPHNAHIKTVYDTRTDTPNTREGVDAKSKSEAASVESPGPCGGHPSSGAATPVPPTVGTTTSDGSVRWRDDAYSRNLPSLTLSLREGKERGRNS